MKRRTLSGKQQGKRRPARGASEKIEVIPWLKALPSRYLPTTGSRVAIHAAFVFFLCLTLYGINFRVYTQGNSFDTVPSRLMPFALLRHGTLTLTDFADEFAARDGYRGYIQIRRGELVAFYPIGAALVATPFYVPVFLYDVLTGRTTDNHLLDDAETVEVLTSIMISSLAAAVLFLLLRRRVSESRALWTALLFALATPMWAVVSQRLWQHGPAVLLLCLLLLVLDHPRTNARAITAGLLMGLLISVRPQCGLFAAAGGVYVLIRAGTVRTAIHDALLVLAGAVIPLAGTLWWNLYYYGSLSGGYALAQSLFSIRHLPVGAAGLLVSPNRGLLVYSPVCLAGLAGCFVALKRFRREPLIALMTIASLAYLAFHAATTIWAAGWVFGPRYATDFLPVLAFASVLTTGWRWKQIALFAPLVVWSVVVEMNGVYCHPLSNWNARMSSNLEEAAWSLSDLQLQEDFDFWLLVRKEEAEANRRGLETWVRTGGNPLRPAARGPSALSYYLFPGCRAFDTRTPHRPLVSGETRRVKFAGRCGVPLAARAVIANVIAIGASSGGELRGRRADAPIGETTLLSFRPAQSRANAAIIELSPKGEIVLSALLTAGGRTDVVIDLSGYLQ